MNKKINAVSQEVKNPFVKIADSVFRLQKLVAIDMLEKVPVEKKNGKKVETRVLLVEKDPSLIFKNTMFRGVPVPQEPFVRILLIKPIFDKAMMASFMQKETNITDVSIELVGDARESVFEMCMKWKGIYEDGNMGVKNPTLPVLTDQRINEIMSFFRFDGNKIYIADPKEEDHFRETKEFLISKGFHLNGKGERGDVLGPAVEAHMVGVAKA